MTYYTQQEEGTKMANTYNRINIAGGGSGANPPYVSTFVVGTWTGPSSGEYEINIPEATHSRGSDVQVDVFEKETIPC
jgi:hypothetical protein